MTLATSNSPGTGRGGKASATSATQVTLRELIRRAYALPGFPSPPPGQRAEGVSVFTALQEQMGLRLEAARGPADVLVIDGAERATGD